MARKPARFIVHRGLSKPKILRHPRGSPNHEPKENGLPLRESDGGGRAVAMTPSSRTIRTCLCVILAPSVPVFMSSSRSGDPCSDRGATESATVIIRIIALNSRLGGAYQFGAFGGIIGAQLAVTEQFAIQTFGLNGQQQNLYAAVGAVFRCFGQQGHAIGLGCDL